MSVHLLGTGLFEAVVACRTRSVTTSTTDSGYRAARCAGIRDTPASTAQAASVNVGRTNSR